MALVVVSKLCPGNVDVSSCSERHSAVNRKKVFFGVLGSGSGSKVSPLFRMNSESPLVCTTACGRPALVRCPSIA